MAFGGGFWASIGQMVAQAIKTAFSLHRADSMVACGVFNSFCSFTLQGCYDCEGVATL
jgi:hypothetical protein